MVKENLISAEIRFAAEFYDVDSMDIVWHGHYLKYFEKARCALLDKIGYGYSEMKASGYAFPVTEVKIKYIRPVIFRQEICVEASLIEYENLIRIKYEIRDALSGDVMTRAVISQMAVDMASGKSLFMCPQVFTDLVEKMRGEIREDLNP